MELESKVKFFQDVAKIKEKNKQRDDLISKDSTKVERKEIDKLLKEKDKLEMQALVLRM